MIIDCQVHPYAPDTPERPWEHPHDDHRPHVTGEEMVMAMDAVGVDGAIAVSSKAIYGYDASYVMQVQRAHPRRFGMVRPVDPEDKAVGETIAEWKKTPGAVAVRLMLAAHSGNDAGAPGVAAICREAARQGLPINLLCGNNLDAVTALIDRHPQTVFALDHLGFRQPRKWPADLANAWADLPKLLELARRPNAVVKVSGACTLAATPFPYEDIWDNLARVFEAWGLERCLWGSDWTRTYPIFPYINAVAPFLLTARLTAGERALLMGGACARVYGWEPGR